MTSKLAGRIAKAYRRRVMPILQICYYNTVCRAWIELFGTRDRRQMKHEISACLIFKDEAPFLKEWLDYHLTVGIDHFYLYNNNSTDNFRQVLAPYLADGTVTLVEWPEPGSQFKAYRHCFDTYRHETRWLSFLDADEFFVPRRDATVGEWLGRYAKYPSVVVHWLMFGTSGLLKHDYGKNVIEQYFICWPRLHKLGKCFINTRYDIARYDTLVHHNTCTRYPVAGIMTTLPSANQFKHFWPAGRLPKSYSAKKADMVCNHYYTKAWDITEQKMTKSDVLYGETGPRKKLEEFYERELPATSADYTIRRFLIKMNQLQKKGGNVKGER